MYVRTSIVSGSVLNSLCTLSHSIVTMTLCLHVRTETLGRAEYLPESLNVGDHTMPRPVWFQSKCPLKAFTLCMFLNQSDQQVLQLDRTIDSIWETDFSFLMNWEDQPWGVWLSDLSIGLWMKGFLTPFPVRAHAWVVGQVPSRGRVRGNHTLMFLSLSFSLPSSLKINK